MSREKGSKNKPKTAQQLLDAVIAAYKKQGKTVSFDIKDIADLTDEQKTEIATAVSENPDLNVPLEFELEHAEDEDSEKLICGNCQAELDGEDSQCPHCGCALTWESEDED